MAKKRRKYPPRDTMAIKLLQGYYVAILWTVRTDGWTDGQERTSVNDNMQLQKL